MSTWRFSDGTTVELGGKVEGATLHAQRLRQQLLLRTPSVQVWPPPGGKVPLDVKDVALLNAWLEQDLEFNRRVRGLILEIVERPSNIPALPDPPWLNQPAPPADAIH